MVTSVLLGRGIPELDAGDLRQYRDGLLQLLVLTRGNRRLARELHATLTHLRRQPSQEPFFADIPRV